MRILHIVEAFSGGVVSYLQTLVSGMDARHEAYILYTQRSNSPKEPERLFPAGTTLIRSEHMSRELSLRADVAAFLEIRRRVKEIRPDVVHLHSSKAGVLGRWAINSRRTAVFYTPNGYSFQMDNCGAFKRGFYFAIEKLSGYRACTTISCGKGEYEIAKRVTPHAIFVNNAIDTAQLDALGLDPDAEAEMSVCTMARIERQKNPELFNAIAQRFPQTHFVWIGDGADRDKLTSPNIEITGWLPRDAAMARMMRSKVYLQPSLWEGLSLSLLEAMYLKRLCIVSRISGNVDAIDDGINGFVCGSLEEYVKTLSTVLTRGVDRQMIQSAREKVLRAFSQRVMVRRYMDAYEDALKLIGGGYDRRIIVSLAYSDKISLAPLSCAAERAVA